MWNDANETARDKPHASALRDVGGAGADPTLASATPVVRLPSGEPPQGLTIRVGRQRLLGVEPNGPLELATRECAHRIATVEAVVHE
jgi:hypothetical protein